MAIQWRMVNADLGIVRHDTVQVGSKVAIIAFPVVSSEKRVELGAMCRVHRPSEGGGACRLEPGNLCKQRLFRSLELWTNK